MSTMHEDMNEDALASDHTGLEVRKPRNAKRQKDLHAHPPVDVNVGWGKTTE